MGSKKKVLWYSDSPTTATGFATVARNLLNVLYKTGKYEFTIVGINHNGAPYDRGRFPYDIYPAMNALASDQRYQDVYGRQLLVDMAATGEFDIVFMIQDTFIVETFMKGLLAVRDKLPKDKKFSIVHYFPIDGKPKQSWIEDVVAKADIPVAYTEFAKKECMKLVPGLEEMDVVYHGVDKDTFYPIAHSEFREQFFRQHKDKFIVLNVNRNQPRKDLYRTFAASPSSIRSTPIRFCSSWPRLRMWGATLLRLLKTVALSGIRIGLVLLPVLMALTKATLFT